MGYVFLTQKERNYLKRIDGVASSIKSARESSSYKNIKITISEGLLNMVNLDRKFSVFKLEDKVHCFMTFQDEDFK